MSRGTVEQLPLVHADDRRRIYETDLAGGSLKRLEVLGCEPIGNHYHERCEKNYLVVSGGGTYASLALDEPRAEVETTAVGIGDLVRIPPRVVHAFVLEPGSVMICYATSAFDIDEPDLVPHRLL